MPPPLPPKIRIERNSAPDPATACWNWTGAISRIDGYGRIGVAYKKMLAHRVSYMDFVGPIDAGLVIDHICFNRACVNPAHLDAVTQKTNAQRAADVGRMDRRSHNSHCKNGHELTAENVSLSLGDRPWRQCRACGRESMRRQRLKKRTK